MLQAEHVGNTDREDCKQAAKNHVVDQDADEEESGLVCSPVANTSIDELNCHQNAHQPFEAILVHKSAKEYSRKAIYQSRTDTRSPGERFVRNLIVRSRVLAKRFVGVGEECPKVISEYHYGEELPETS